MATAKNRLSNMKLSEVTLCRKGKVPGAVVTLYKTASTATDPDGDGDTDVLDFTSALAREQLRQQVQGICSDMWTAWDAFQDSIISIGAGGDPDDADNTPLTPEQRKAALTETISQFTSWLTDQVPALAVAKAVSKGLSQGGASGPSISYQENLMTMTELAQALEKAQGDLATANTQNETLKKSVETLTAQVAELKKAAPAAGSTTEEDIFKGLPAPVREMIEKSQADAKAAVEKAAKLEESAAIATSIAKAAPLVGILPTDATKLGTLLHEVRKGVAAEHADELERLLKANAEMAADGKALFEAIGKAGGDHGGASSGGAMAEIEAKAADLRKADPKLSQAQSIAKATKENPELYKRHQVENRGYA